MTRLSLLSGCTQIVSLHLSESPRTTTNLRRRHDDVYRDTIAWLGRCKPLKSVELSHFSDASWLLAEALPRRDFRLERLTVDGYAVAAAIPFHRALRDQPGLQSTSEGYW